jgi:hypothetical protein
MAAQTPFGMTSSALRRICDGVSRPSRIATLRMLRHKMLNYLPRKVQLPLNGLIRNDSYRQCMPQHASALSTASPFSPCYIVMQAELAHSPNLLSPKAPDSVLGSCGGMLSRVPSESMTLKMTSADSVQ